MRLDELEKWLQYNRQTFNKKFIKHNTNDTKSITVDDALYRIELPILPTDADTKKQYERLVNNICYAIKTKYPDTVVKIGYSEHKHWTPYVMETSSKGGKPHKVFSDAPTYKRKGHIHNFIAGKNCHKLAKKLYETESKYVRKHFPKIKIRKPKNAIRSTHHIPAEYIDWQSSKCRDFGDLESYIEEHKQSTFDPLDFDG